MTWNRRRFVTHGALTLGLGGVLTAPKTHAGCVGACSAEPLTCYERVFAETTHLAALGLPRSWESVRQGFHPFSPDRIAILPAEGRPNPGLVAHRARRVRETLRDRPPDVPESFWSSDSFRLYVEVAEALGAYYPGMPADDWLRSLAIGEQFYGLSTVAWIKWLISLHFSPGQTPVVNPPVDWWLFLLRDPPVVETFAGVERPRCAVGQVFAGPRESSSFYCDVGFLCQEWLRSLEETPAFVAEVAAMDRVSAARWMNLEMALVLERLQEEKR